MLVLQQTVFDDFVAGTAPAYTDASWNPTLGGADKLAIMAVADQVSGTSAITLTVAIEHSGDGRNFLSKNAAAEINAQTIDSTQTWALNGSDSGVTPSLGFVRLRVQLASASAAQAHVRIHVTGRDNAGASKSIT